MMNRPFARFALLTLFLCLATCSFAQDDPNPLLVSDDGTDALLTWSPAGDPYTVWRGMDPANLQAWDTVPVNAWTDPGVADESDRNLYFYRIEDTSSTLQQGEGILTNMGFKIARDLNQVPGGVSLYVVSFPFRRSFPDVWDARMRQLGSDGLVLSDDVLAYWMTGGDGTCDFAFPSECNGTISLYRFDNDPASPNFNRFVGQTITVNPFLQRLSISGMPFRIDETPQQGFLVQVTRGSFPATIVGSHDPEVTSWHLETVPGSRGIDLFSLPPHTTWTTSEELLMAGWDHRIEDPDPPFGMPFAFSICGFENDQSNPAANYWICQTVTPNPFLGGEPVISGNPFPLVPGNGYLLQIVRGATELPLPHH